MAMDGGRRPITPWPLVIQRRDRHSPHGPEVPYRAMDLGLANKVAMVGGASKGLGFAVARALAAEGAHVSIASRDEDGIERAAAAINDAAGGRALAVSADLSKADAITRWAAATSDRFGG